MLYSVIILLCSGIYECNSRNLSELGSSSNKALLQIVNFPSFLLILTKNIYIHSNQTRIH
jgi:hypothetical protein